MDKIAIKAHYHNFSMIYICYYFNIVLYRQKRRNSIHIQNIDIIPTYVLYYTNYSVNFQEYNTLSIKEHCLISLSFRDISYYQQAFTLQKMAITLLESDKFYVIEQVKSSFILGGFFFCEKIFYENSAFVFPFYSLNSVLFIGIKKK